MNFCGVRFVSNLNISAVLRAFFSCGTFEVPCFFEKMSGGNNLAEDRTVTCRFCLEEEHLSPGEKVLKSEWVRPCACKGTVEFVHQKCLLCWYTNDKKDFCSICKVPYSMKKVLKPLREWKWRDLFLVFGFFLICLLLIYVFYCVSFRLLGSDFLHELLYFLSIVWGLVWLMVDLPVGAFVIYMCVSCIEVIDEMFLNNRLKTSFVFLDFSQ